VSQNPNFVTFYLEQDIDDDEIDDGSNINLPPLSVYTSAGAKIISTPPANSLVLFSNFLTIIPLNAVPSATQSFVPPPFSVSPFPFHLSLPTTPYNLSIPGCCCSSRQHSAPSSPSHKHRQMAEEVEELCNILCGQE
jgi:hypothetical protein